MIVHDCTWLYMIVNDYQVASKKDSKLYSYVYITHYVYIYIYIILHCYLPCFIILTALSMFFCSETHGSVVLFMAFSKAGGQIEVWSYAAARILGV